MPIEILEARLKIAQIALAYLYNIVRDSNQQVLDAKVHLEQFQLNILLEVQDRMEVFAVLNELQWYMELQELTYYNVWGKQFCKFGVNLAVQRKHNGAEIQT